jgi:hypothetical protein
MITFNPLTGNFDMTGANETLSNLASVAINQSLISDTNNTYDLGSSAKKWKDLYLSGNAGITIADGGNKVGLTVTQNDVTNNPNAVTIVNAGAGNGIGLDQNGEGYAFFMDTAATTFAGMKLYRNVAAVAQGEEQEQRPILFIHEDNSVSATGLVFLRDDSTKGASMFIDMNADKEDGDGTNCALRLYTGTAQTGPNSGYLLNAAVANVNSQMGAAFFRSIANPTTPRGAVRIDCLGEQKGLYVWTEADTHSYAGIYIDVHGKTNAIYAARNEADADTYLGYFINDHASSSGGAMLIRQDGTGTNLYLDQNGNGAALYIDNAGSGNDITAPNFTLTNGALTATSISVGGNQVIGARVVDARIDDTPNSGDATTDGIIAALQSIIQSHGLGAAA